MCEHENLIVTKTVSMWAQSQTAWLCKLRNVLTRWDTQQTVSSAWGTVHCYWCAGLCCDKLQVLCVPFTGVFCVKGLCLLYFHHAEEVFKSSWHLLLRVWWPDLQMSEAKLYPARKEMLWAFLCFVDPASLYILFQMKPARCTLLLSIFISTSLNVSGNYVPIIRRIWCIYAKLVFFTLWVAAVSHRYIKFSWWWAHSCPKHAEKLK